ncbi:MAG: DUF308 domain-containing protein [Ktedonobacteraceae bacterium]|nr:DUF308 domain-containing protein [Ktedonobacteraceae bacterium]
MRPHFASMTGTTTRDHTPWWLVMIAGIAMFIVGVLLLISPGMTLLVLVQLLGAYWLVTGTLSFASLCLDRNQWGWKLVTGILGVLAGLLVLRDPLWSAFLVPVVLVIILAIEALIMGVAQIIHAFSGGGFGLAVLGILNIIFGLILLFNPLIGALVLPIILGIFAVIGGILAALRAFVSRPQAAHIQPPGAQPA